MEVKQSAKQIMEMERVFGAYELHEHILSFLQPLEILQCRRVSGQWSAIIADSLQLQQCLFLAPCAAGKVWILRYNPVISIAPSDPGLPPSLRPASSSYEVASIVSAAELLAVKVCGKDRACLVARPNPLLLAKTSRSGHDRPVNLRAISSETRSLINVGNGSPHHNGIPITQPGDIREKMLLTQPPAQSVAVKITISDFRYNRNVARFYKTVWRDDGVRYEEVLSVIHNVDPGTWRRIADVGLEFEGMVFASEEEEGDAERQAWVWMERETVKGLGGA